MSAPLRAAAADRSRDRILAAAAELAHERGVTGATIARVCERSGLPVSSIYWHFQDKDDLFAEVIRVSFAAWLVTVPRWEVTDGTTIEEGLRGILGPSMRSLVKVPDFMGVGMQVLLESGEQNAKTREAFLQTRDQVRRMIAAWISRVAGPETPTRFADDLATVIVAFSDGMLVGSQFYDDWEPQLYVDLFAGMLAASVEAARDMTAQPEAPDRGHDGPPE